MASEEWIETPNRRQSDSRRKKQTDLLRRIQNIFVCDHRESYDLENAENDIMAKTPKQITFTEKVRRKLGFRKCVEAHNETLTDTERFYMSLYNEGLLRNNFIIDDNRGTGQPMTIVTVYEYPVIDICYGFRDDQIAGRRKLRMNTYVCHETQHGLVSRTSPEALIQVGLNRVLMDNRDPGNELTVDNIPASLWLDTMEPAIQMLLLMRGSRRNPRANITLRRRPSPHYVNNSIIGDVQPTYVMIGPHVLHDEHRAGVFSLFAHRLLELGERHRRIGILRTDAVIPVSRTNTQNANASRTRSTRALPDALRNENPIVERDQTNSAMLRIPSHEEQLPAADNHGNEARDQEQR